MIGEEFSEYKFYCSSDDDQNSSMDANVLAKCEDYLRKNTDQNCPTANEDINLLKCKTCGSTTEQHLRKLPKKLKRKTDSYLTDLFISMERESYFRPDDFESDFEKDKGEEEFLRILDFEYIKEEIDVRIGDILEANRASNIFERIFIPINESGNLKELKIVLAEFEESNRKHENKNEEYSSKYQATLCLLSDLLEELDDILLNKIFSSSDVILTEIENLLIEGKQEVMDVMEITFNIFALPDNQFIMLHRYTITIRDAEFNLIRRISDINGESFNADEVEINTKMKCLYIINKLTNTILMTDYDFKLIKSKILHYCDAYIAKLSFHDSTLYLCDCELQKIFVYSQNLIFECYIELGNMPLQILVRNSLLYVEYNKSIHIYHVYKEKDGEKCFRNLRHIRKSSSLRMCEISSFYFAVNFESKSVYFYDGRGRFRRRVELTGQVANFLKSRTDGHFIQLNDKLLMFSRSENKIISFTKESLDH